MYHTINTATLVFLISFTAYSHLTQEARLNEIEQKESIMSQQIDTLKFDQKADVKRFTRESFKELIDPKNNDINETEEYLK